MTYADQLKRPEWLHKKAKIWERDGYQCFNCDNDRLETLDVHHVGYFKHRPMAWEYPDYLLVSLCRKCHQKEHDLNRVGNYQKTIEWITKLILPTPSTDTFTDEYVQAIMRGDKFQEGSPNDPLVVYLSRRLNS